MENYRVFDPVKGFGGITNLRSLTDCTIVNLQNRWWMFIGGASGKGFPDLNIYSASLPPGKPLSPHGWEITVEPRDRSSAAVLANKTSSYLWDGRGGRHCPSFVRGFDPDLDRWVDRIYYAGASDNPAGPYSIGYLEFDGIRWIEQETPVFTANEKWEDGSVFEPNLIYHDGKWKMWYVAGKVSGNINADEPDDYLVQGYAESSDGKSDWTRHSIFAPSSARMFDFNVFKGPNGYEAVFSKVSFGSSVPDDTGLWHTTAREPYSNLSDWSEPARISESGPWKPSAAYDASDKEKLFVFCDGAYFNASGDGFPYVFTLDCIIVKPH